MQLDNGTALGVWHVIKKLGEGGCGAVYLVESRVDRRRAALKAESNFAEGGSVLKLEVDILGKLRDKKHVCKLLHCGRRDAFQYIVMSLLGESLESLIRACNNLLSVSSQLRVGVHVLHGLKQIHDAGFVHRDIKPANLALGHKDGGTDPNFIYVLDFGLARSFVLTDAKGKKLLRKPRKHALFRGTTRYCSANAHRKHDQSRAEDLWSLLYVMLELRGRLPWADLNEHPELAEAKATADDNELFGDSPSQLRDFAQHLRTLDYFTRPDYRKLYRLLMDAMDDGGYKFSDPWDWQLKRMAAAAAKQGGGPGGLGRASRKGGRLASLKNSIKNKVSAKGPTKKSRTRKDRASGKSVKGGGGGTAATLRASDPQTEEIVLPGAHPFTEEDFSTDPIGF